MAEAIIILTYFLAEYICTGTPVLDEAHHKQAAKASEPRHHNLSEPEKTRKSRRGRLSLACDERRVKTLEQTLAEVIKSGTGMDVIWAAG